MDSPNEDFAQAQEGRESRTLLCSLNSMQAGQARMQHPYSFGFQQSCFRLAALPGVCWESPSPAVPIAAA